MGDAVWAGLFGLLGFLIGCWGTWWWMRDVDQSMRLPGPHTGTECTRQRIAVDEGVRQFPMALVWSDPSCGWIK